MKDNIHILGATDDHYVPWYGIMLTSLFENNPGEQFCVHLLTEGLSEENAGRLMEMSSRYGQSIETVKVDKQVLQQCPIRPGDHVSMATWYRLIASSLLPSDIDKVLYLDGDIIVNGTVRDLWDTDLSSVAIAAVIDESYWNPEIYERLGISPSVPYTSAGVLLMHLKYWRENEGTERCLRCIDQMADSLLFHDQDTVNVVFQYEKKLLPIGYNYQCGFIRSWSFVQCDNKMKAEIMKNAQNPVVIHFSGPGKPWFRFNDHPFRPLFMQWKKKSLWKTTPLQNAHPGIGLIRDAAGYYARILNIKQSQYII